MDWKNRLYVGDSRWMEAVPSDAIDLIVTSPPYNVNRAYGAYKDARSLQEYLAMLNEVWYECHRVLKPGGRLCINVANIERQPYNPLNARITLAIIEAGRETGPFLMRGEILWNKAACLSGNTGVMVRDRATGRVSRRRLLELHDHGGWRDVDIEALDKQGNVVWQPIIRMWESPSTEGCTFTFTDGSSITSTDNHRFVRLDGSLVYAQDLQIGDQLKRVKTMASFDGHVPTAFANEDLAWALGLYLAEGSISSRRAYGVAGIRYTLHREEMQWVERLRAAWEPFGCTVTPQIGAKRPNTLAVNVYGHIGYVIVSEFLNGTTAKDKLPLNSVIGAPARWRQAFLQGWFDGDGHYDTQNQRWMGNITGANPRLMRRLRVLSRSLDYRLQHSAGWAKDNGHRHMIIRWKLYLKESKYPTAASWEAVEIKEIQRQKARFFDLTLPEEPHLFLIDNGLVTHNSVGVSTAWGSWRSPSNPTLRDVHEYIMVYSKDQLRLPRRGPHSHSDITPAEFTEYTRSIWTFATESARRIGHPAPFPLELPRRLIKLYTYTDGTVLDPFCGSGTTCVAAKELGRSYVGFDIDPAYINLAERRLRQISWPVPSPVALVPPKKPAGKQALPRRRAP